MATLSSELDLQAFVDDRDLRRSISAREVTEAFLDRIAQRDPILHAVVTPTPEIALEAADRVDRARRAGQPLVLDGMPVVLKDNIDVAGVRSTCGSKLFVERVAQEDSAVVRILRDAGAVILGKSHSTELMCSLSAHPDLPQCRSPWDDARMPGATSSGSAVALADDQALGALGTDTGGSVRVPSSCCGVTGLRPTHGVISNAGVFPLARSLDTVGPMARSAADVADLFFVLARFDPNDTRSVPYHPNRSVAANGRSSCRIGVPRQFYFEGCDRDVEERVRAAIDEFRRLGHSIVEIDLPLAEMAYRRCGVLLGVEAYALHADWLRERPEDFSDGLRARLQPAERITGRDVALLIEDAHAWKRQLGETFGAIVDVIMTPTTQFEPPRWDDGGDTPPDIARFTYGWGLAGVPALSIPCGFTMSGLPVGLQIAGPAHSEWRLLDLARAYQVVTDWHRRRPAA